MMNRLIRYAETAGLALASLCICGVMLVTAGDTVMRYLFRSPWPWAFDVTSQYLLVGGAYLGISSTFSMGDHINIDILHRRLPAKLRAWIDAFFAAAFVVLFSMIGYLALKVSVHAAINNEYIPGYFNWPIWLSFAPIPLGTAILCLRLAHHLVTLLKDGADTYVSVAHGEKEGVE